MDGEQMQSHFSGRSAKWEVPDKLSWLQCFISIWLWSPLTIQETPGSCGPIKPCWSKRQGGVEAEDTKILYNSAFRQQLTSFDAVDFSKTNQSFYNTTILACGGGGTNVSCPKCINV